MHQARQPETMAQVSFTPKGPRSGPSLHCRLLGTGLHSFFFSSFYFTFSFGHTLQFMDHEFPDQGLNPGFQQ